MTLDEAKALDAADPLARFRERFRLPGGQIYLDGNSLGPLPSAAAYRMAVVVEREWGQDLITSWNRHGWVDLPGTLARKLAPIVGAGPDELLVTDSTSVNLFKLLAAALAARPGRTVILSEEGNFPTDLYIAQGLARMLTGVELRTVAPEVLDEALDEEVAVLMLTHVDYRSAQRHDMARRAEAAHRAGALMLWDLSHSAGALEIDLAVSGADLAVGCGYKYLNGGPGAPAYLFVARAIQDQLDNQLSGWFGHADPFAFESKYRPRPGIGQFQTGTPSVLAMAALDAGLDTFEGVAMRDVETKGRVLSDFFIASVERLCPDLVLASPRKASARGSHVVFAHAQGYALMQALIARGVIGDFRAPDLVRFGFAPLYNRFEDAWRAAAILGDMLASGEWDRPEFHARAAVT